ncbi:MAG: energy transducer TonB [Saprospiraceae bacterium]|nr:energy transducer TonB [Saprospiraceae bacterium]
MDTYQSLVLRLTLAIFTLPLLLCAQVGKIKPLNFEVNQIYPPLSHSSKELAEAKTLMDLSPYYKPAWVREFLSVDIHTTQDGKPKITNGKNDQITAAQMDALLTADILTERAVLVKYIPENTLSQNEHKELKFTFSIDPENKAEFPGGDKALKGYIQERAISKIAKGVFEGFALAAIRFTINEKGNLENVYVFESSKDENTDALLLKAIHEMPAWLPASYGSGEKVKQEYVLTVGNTDNCIMNLLNIKRDL